MATKIYYRTARLCFGLCLALAFSQQASAQRTLSTPNPSKEATALYCYIQSIAGKKILSGQMWASWGIDELAYIQTNTGKQPAIRGMDYMATNENNSETQHAIDWWRSGGIPTIMWHWGAPGIGEGYENSKKKIDINRCFQAGTVEFTSFWSELTKKADQLQKLRDANVPVLWRPFHELNGGWFWWGMGGADQFKKLWTTMYNYFVNDRKLNNLIWVLCYTGDPNGAWFPGNQFVDIAGADTYGVGSNPQLAMYNKTKSSIGGNTMPIAYHECGTPPDPDLCLSQGAMWSWWMEWHTSHLEAVDKAYLRRVYNHDLIITLDELPNFSTICGGTTTNTPPTVSVTSPANNASFAAPASITINATAADANGTISNVQFFNGATLLGSDATAPYSFTWPGVAAGTYSITAKATDNAGATTTSSVVSVTVTGGTTTNTPPVVNISSPVNSASFTAPASIIINATATDANGTVSNVQFFNGVTLLGSDATAPYSFTWSGVAVGSYTLTARATDNAGASSTSLAVAINVTGGTTSTADVVGPDCGAANTTLSFALNTTKRANVSSYTWWYTGSAASTTIVAGAPFSATVQTGTDFSAGQICVGVNLTVAPWYTSYCKAITRCAALANNKGIKAIITPNPSTDGYTIVVPAAVQSYTITNYLGVVVLKGGAIGKMGSLKFGSSLPKGNYIISLQYRDGLIESKGIQKLE